MTDMARVLVKYFATIREITGKKNEEIEADKVRDVLDMMKTQYGQKFVEIAIEPETGELKTFFSCMVNGRRIELLDGYETVLQDGDAVAMFPQEIFSAGKRTNPVLIAVPVRSGTENGGRS